MPADPYLLKSVVTDSEHPPTLQPWRVWLDLVANDDDRAADVLHERVLARASAR